MHAVEYKISCR